MAQGIKAGGAARVYGWREPRECAADDCKVVFKHRDVGRIRLYCSKRCQIRQSIREGRRNNFPPVSAEMKYAEGPRPLCECHGEPMLWCAVKSLKAGGRWQCRRYRSEYRRAYRKRRGKEYRAREIRRDKLRGTYDISLQEYDDLLAAQEGMCALCSRTALEEGRFLSVDHDHVTGRVRGILCLACNFAIERIAADPAWGMRVLAYLQREAAP